MGLRSFSRYRHLLWITALVLVASGTLLLAACGGTSTGPSTPTSTTTQQGSTATSTTSSGGNTFNVSIVEKAGVYSFNPPALTVPKGTTVTWTNNSDGSHTVTSDTNAFTASTTFKEAQTFQMVFATAGTYAYHCTIHSYMKATIIVTP